MSQHRVRFVLVLWVIIAQLDFCFGGVVPERAPAPADNPITAEKIELGKKLFFDKRLSLTKTVSCESCHRVTGPNPNGTDSSPVSTGIGGLKGGRNAPTVWNSGLRTALFIDGRAKSLEDQAIGPLINPIEMGLADHATAVAIVESIPEYRAEFQKVFKDSRKQNSKITIDEIAKAIATYERTLVTPNSAFDRYTLGDITALSPSAKRGWDKFQSLGCIACHGAATFSNADYFMRFPMRSVPDIDLVFEFTADPGRAAATKNPKDNNTWRVPSLRNVEITAPYFHNGSVSSLEQAVRIMGRAQLYRSLSKDEVSDLVSFLKSLTGKAPVQTQPKSSH